MKKMVLALLTLLFLNTVSFSKIITDNVKIKIPLNFYTYEFTLKELTNIYPFVKELKEVQYFKDLSNLFDLNTRVIIITNNKNKVEFLNNIMKDYKFLDSPKFNFLKIELDKMTKSKDEIEILNLYFSMLKKLAFYNDKTMWIYVGNIEIKNLDNVNASTFKNEFKSEVIKFEKDITANPLGLKFTNIDVNQNYFNEMIINLDSELEKPAKVINKGIVSFKNRKAIMAYINCYNNCEYVDSLFNSVLQPSFLLQKSNYTKTDNVKQHKDIPKQLEELNNLYKSGALTEKEFKAAKVKILQ
jgi:hypothetical protein